MHLAFLEPRDGVAGRCVGASLRLFRPIRDLSIQTPYQREHLATRWDGALELGVNYMGKPPTEFPLFVS